MGENRRLDIFVKRHIGVWTLSYCHYLRHYVSDIRRGKTELLCAKHTFFIHSQVD